MFRTRRLTGEDDEDNEEWGDGSVHSGSLYVDEKQSAPALDEFDLSNEESRPIPNPRSLIPQKHQLHPTPRRNLLQRRSPWSRTTLK